MKILVTGSNGQLGRELRNVLEEELPGITTYTDVDDLDICDGKAVEQFVIDGEYTHIVNCAAYTAVDKAESEQTLCYAINAEAVKNIAAAASKAGAKVLHISTDYVFDGTSCRPYKESDKVNPV
ncbi:MAG: sugar nucleotide-binding protein, partial [Muribaculaceae bacterium]|nr:sugar nucleotide-binding protein [Muribaculaceae bacterium]